MRLSDETRKDLKSQAEARGVAAATLARQLIADGVARRPPSIVDLVRLALVGAPGVSQVWIVGSWAACLAGDDVEPADLDLLVVVEEGADLARLERSAAELELVVGTDVDMIYRTPEGVAEGRGQVLHTILSRPMVRAI